MREKSVRLLEQLLYHRYVLRNMAPVFPLLHQDIRWIGAERNEQSRGKTETEQMLIANVKETPRGVPDNPLPYKNDPLAVDFFWFAE